MYQRSFHLLIEITDFDRLNAFGDKSFLHIFTFSTSSRSLWAKCIKERTIDFLQSVDESRTNTMNYLWVMDYIFFIIYLRNSNSIMLFSLTAVPCTVVGDPVANRSQCSDCCPFTVLGWLSLRKQIRQSWWQSRRFRHLPRWLRSFRRRLLSLPWRTRRPFHGRFRHENSSNQTRNWRRSRAWILQLLF